MKASGRHFAGFEGYSKASRMPAQDDPAESAEYSAQDASSEMEFVAEVT